MLSLEFSKKMEECAMLQRMDPPKCSVTYAKSIGRSVYFRKFSFQHFSTAFFNITLTPKLNILVVRHQNKMTVIPHPPYSPDLAPCYFFLFHRMKCQMKGKRFVDVSEVKKKTLIFLNNISIEEFQKCFRQWDKTLVQVYRVKRRVL